MLKIRCLMLKYRGLLFTNLDTLESWKVIITDWPKRKMKVAGWNDNYLLKLLRTL